jgi:hypothetical protein
MTNDGNPTKSRFVRGVGYVLHWLIACVAIGLGLVGLSIASPTSSLVDLAIITPIAAAFAFGTWWLRRWTLRSLDVPARCSRCGYDMRHLREPRCPECGAIVHFTRSAEEMGIHANELRWKKEE